MQGYEIFTLSIIELTAMLMIWNKLNNKLNISTIKNIVVIITIAVTTVIFFIHNIDIGFIINFIVLCIMVRALFQLSIKEAVLQLAIVIIAIASIQLVLTHILWGFTDMPGFLFINGLMVNTITLITIILIKKFVAFDKIHTYYLRYRNYMTIIITNIAGMVLLFMYVWRVNESFVKDHIFYLLLAIIVWEGLNIYFLYQSIQIKEQQKLLDIHKKYTPFLEDMVDEVRQRQHEFKNHLSVLYGLTQIENPKEAKLEMKQYIETIIERAKTPDQLLQIKNNILSAIIYSKKSLAEEKNISFDVEFQGEIPEYPLEKYELVELLGNLLNNAIEATEDRGNAAKVVLILGIEKDTKIIEVRNIGEDLPQETIDSIFQKGFTTKKGKHRGYGLYNVKKIVDYYKGTIELSFDEGYTIFKILL
ncbi:MAG: GHKL domain-containing protein [Clostridiaceae bacterium]|nr:GHKL domain-containing protein [Clostridiaceae bacterium]